MALAYPEARWVGYVLIGIGFVPLTWWALNKLLSPLSSGWRPSIGATLLIFVGGGLGALCVFTGLGMMYFQHQEHQRTNPKLDGEPQDTGRLEPIIQTVLDGERQQLRRVLEIGNSGTKFITDKNIPFFSFFGTSELRVEVLDGQLKVSTKIFDKDGKLAAELIRNEWKVAKEPIIWDRNYTKNALEVRASDGRIVLQVLLEDDVVHMQGVWRGPTGKGVMLIENDGSEGGGLMISLSPGSTADKAIKPMFKYPSKTNFGEYAE